MIEVYIRDQPEKLPNYERTIDWIGSLMDQYAAAWHIQWIKGTLAGKHLKSITGYIQEVKLGFEDRDTKHEAYAELEKVRYDGCIRDMFTQIQMHNDKAMVSGPALKQMIRDCISKKYFHGRRITPSQWTCSVRAVRDTPVVYNSALGLNTTCCIAYPPPITVSPFPHPLSVSNFE
jgi:hypothetical protein